MKLNYGRRIHSVINQYGSKPNVRVAPWPQWRSCFRRSGSIGEPSTSPLVACFLHIYCYFSLEVLLFWLQVGYKKNHLQGLSALLVNWERAVFGWSHSHRSWPLEWNGHGSSHKTLLLMVSLPAELVTLIPPLKHGELATSQAHGWLRNTARDGLFVENHLILWNSDFFTPPSPTPHQTSMMGTRLARLFIPCISLSLPAEQILRWEHNVCCF